MGALRQDLKDAHANDVAAMPANIEAEQALLGCILYDNAAYERLDDGLRAEHFHEPFHGRLFALIENTLRKGQLAEPITLMDAFQADPAFEELGGVSYLADLVDRAPPAASARDYARIVKDMALRRSMLGTFADVGALLLEDVETPAADHLELAEQELFRLAESKAQAGFVSFSEAVAGAISMAAEAHSRDGGLAGLSTGLIDMDAKIGGLHPSDLVILAARPSMGKTSMACNIAFDAARNYAYEPQPDGSHKTVRGGIVAFFSLEMSAEQLAMRLLAQVSGVSGDRMRKGELDAMEFGRVRDAAIEISEAPLYIDATGGITLAKLTARARRLKRTVGLDLIVVDYLQLVTIGGKTENRVQEVSQITQGLKALAKELGVPVLALSQLSRAVESRDDKKPQLSDLRDSGSIEQDADMVIFLYREEYYLSRMEPRAGTEEHLRWIAQMDEVRGLAEAIIGKQRHGPIGTVRLTFDENLTKFGNLARESSFAARNPYGDD